MRDWREFYELTRETPPGPFLVKAVALLQQKEDALDLGCAGFQPNAEEGACRLQEPCMVDLSKERGRQSGSHAIARSYASRCRGIQLLKNVK